MSSDDISVTESFLGSLFDESPASEPVVPQLELPSVDTKLSTATIDSPTSSIGLWTKIVQFFKSISPRTYYIIAAVLVFLLILYLYKYKSSSPSAEMYHHHDHHGHDHSHHGHQHQVPMIPIQPPIVPEPQPMIKITPQKVKHSELEHLIAEMNNYYTDFQEALHVPKPDVRALETWFDTLHIVFEKMKQVFMSMSPSEQAEAQSKMQNAEVILVNATSVIQEKKRLSQTEEEGFNVVKNMHHMGFGNKIKHVKPIQPEASTPE